MESLGRQFRQNEVTGQGTWPNRAGVLASRGRNSRNLSLMLHVHTEERAGEDTGEAVATYRPGREPSWATEFADTLIMDFQPPTLWENKSLWSKPSACGILLWIPWGLGYLGDDRKSTNVQGFNLSHRMEVKSTVIKNSDSKPFCVPFNISFVHLKKLFSPHWNSRWIRAQESHFFLVLS